MHSVIHTISSTPPNSLPKEEEVALGTALWMRATWLKEVKSPVGTHLAIVQSESRVGTQRKAELWVTSL